MKHLFKCVIKGRPIVKKNTQRTVGLGRNRRVTYSPVYRAWESQAQVACAFKRTKTFDVPLVVVFRFYFKNRHAEADTSNLIEGPQDVLTKMKIIEDDRLIRKVVAEKFFGEEPRTEIELYEYEKQPSGAQGH